MPFFCERSSGLSYPPRQQGEGASRQKLIGAQLMSLSYDASVEGSFLAAVILCEGGGVLPAFPPDGGEGRWRRADPAAAWPVETSPHSCPTP